MSIATKSGYQHIGESNGCADHDHDMVHELSRRLDGIWRYDQYIANSEGHAGLKEFWQIVKSQEQENIRKLKELLGQHVQSDCF
jgi:hypothetical protein